MQLKIPIDLHQWNEMLLVPLVIIFLTHAQSGIILPEPHNERGTNCVFDILQSHTKLSDLILVDICGEPLDYSNRPDRSMILLNTCAKRKFRLLQRPHFYVLYLGTFEDFTTTMRVLLESSSWNPRAKIILYIPLYFTRDYHLILDVLKFHFIGRFIVLSPSEQSIDIYAWESPDLSMAYVDPAPNLQLIGQCRDGVLLNNSLDLFPKRFYSNFSFYTVKIATVRIPPYLININSTRDPGLEILLIRLLQERLNFPVEYIKNPFKTWGLKINGKYTDTFSLLVNRTADIMLAMWHPNTSDNLDFDCTFCYMEDAVVWFVPSARWVAPWKTLFFTFSTELWIGAMVTLCLVAVIWSYYNRRRNRSLTQALVDLWGIHLGIAVAGSPPPGPYRMLYFGWVVYSFLLVCAYQSKLISVLTQPIYDHQIHSLQDIYDANIQFGFHYGLFRLFENETNPTYQKIYREVVSCPLSEECLNRTAFQRDFANAKGRRQTKFLMPKYYVDSAGNLLLYGFRSALWWYPIQMVMVKGLPIFDRANELLYRIKQSGFITKWYNDVDRVNKYYMSRSQASSADASVITLEHLQGPFFLLIVGLLAAIVAFSVECVRSHKRINKQKIK